jgi:peptidoglycan hydrolase-like protein with peptidoglycan-binding domain
MNQGPTLRRGSQGRDVRRLQRLFVMMKTLGVGDIDGVFGPRTERAVRDFQQDEGLTVDGIVGQQTWHALPADPDTPQLSRGSSGHAVSGLQRGLKRYGRPGTDPGAVDGQFGPRTESAVRAYQRDRSIGVDGIVGDVTWWTPAGAAGATLASLSGLTTV